MRQSHLLHPSAALYHEAPPNLHSHHPGMKVLGCCYHDSTVARAEVEHRLIRVHRSQGVHLRYDVSRSRDVWFGVIHLCQVVSRLREASRWQGLRRLLSRRPSSQLLVWQGTVTYGAENGIHTVNPKTKGYLEARLPLNWPRSLWSFWYSSARYFRALVTVLRLQRDSVRLAAA